MRTKPGRRDDVIKLLLRDQTALRHTGCQLYLVGRNDEEPDPVYVAEVWTSKLAHGDSLQSSRPRRR
jgi:quinol monooxygenase YgiN